LAPGVVIEAATPIRAASGDIIGVVITDQAIDSTFLDGIKHATNLDSAVYAGDVVSATTFVAPDGSSRSIGVSQPSTAVQQLVLGGGQTFKGSLSILNRSYLVVYAPLKDVNNNVIGMLLTAQPQQTLLKTIAHSIELTFLAAIGLLLIMIIPAYLLASKMARQFQ
jgi:methyl-accepting chemotaxis protein